MNLESTPTIIQINISMLGATPTVQDVILSKPSLAYHGAFYTGRKEAASKTKVDTSRSLDILLNQVEAGYKLLRPIPVTIRETDGSFVASFTAANINTSGDTWDEAALNLKSLIVNLFN